MKQSIYGGFCHEFAHLINAEFLWRSGFSLLLTSISCHWCAEQIYRPVTFHKGVKLSIEEARFDFIQQ